MISNPQQTIDLIATLRAFPEWTVRNIESTLGVRLSRDQKTSAKLKRYNGPARESLFTRATLDQPIFGGHLGWRALVRVSEAGDVRRSEVGPLLAGAQSGAYHPPPTPGSAGNAAFRFSLQVTHPGGVDSFTFIRRADHVERLEAINLQRPHPGNDPSYFDASCFHAYTMQEDAGSSYVIERSLTRSEAIVVSKVVLKGRALSLSYVATEIMIGESLARELIRSRLIEGLLAPNLGGRYDKINFASLELGSTVTERG